jgi:hypothetical protein
MAPIYDTDQAEDRWLKAKWDQYELWNKVELRLRRQKRLWITSTFVVFILISAIPVFMSKWPKWVGVYGTREIALLINQMKKDAGTKHAAFELTFDPNQTLKFQIHKKNSCNEVGAGQLVQSGYVLDELLVGSYVLLGAEAAEKLGFPGLKTKFCYDPMLGSSATPKSEDAVGFGIIPAKDLTVGRSDRLSILLISGPNAELTFESNPEL